jgi:hypothetical protein
MSNFRKRFVVSEIIKALVFKFLLKNVKKRERGNHLFAQ